VVTLSTSRGPCERQSNTAVSSPNVTRTGEHQRWHWARP